MDPSIPDHFSWQAVYDDPEGFARTLAIENQPSPNHEQVTVFRPDALHPYGSQARTDSFYPHFPDGSSGFSQTFVSQYYHQPIGDVAQPPGSQQYGPNYDTAAIADPSASQQSNPFNDSAASDQPFSSQRYGQDYQTAAFAETSSSQRYGPHDHAAVFSVPSAWQRFGQNPQPSALDEPSGSHQFGQYVDPFSPIEDNEHPIQAHITETAADSCYQPDGVHGSGSHPSTRLVEEPSALAQPPQSRHLDHHGLQEIQASIAKEFPRIRTQEFDDSTLSRAFMAFAKAGRANVFKIARLGKIDHNFNLSTMADIIQKEKGPALVSAINHLNKMMKHYQIGIIERPTSRGCFRFIKLQNFNFVDIFCEACTAISHDFHIDDLPYKYLKIIAMLYGKPRLSREALSSMLDMCPNSLRDSIHKCNELLINKRSPVKIAMFIEHLRFYYHLTINNFDYLP